MLLDPGSRSRELAVTVTLGFTGLRKQVCWLPDFWGSHCNLRQPNRRPRFWFQPLHRPDDLCPSKITCFMKMGIIVITLNGTVVVNHWAHVFRAPTQLWEALVGVYIMNERTSYVPGSVQGRQSWVKSLPYHLHVRSGKSFNLTETQFPHLKIRRITVPILPN